MPTNQAVFNPGSMWFLAGEFDITTAGAVLTTDGSKRLPDGATVTRTATGAYTVNVPGVFQKVLFRIANYADSASPGAAKGEAECVSVITSTTLTAGGGATTDVNIITVAANASGDTAADLALGTISFLVIGQKNKI